MTRTMLKPIITVVLSTHNPRIDYLEHCLNGLKNQTLDANLWEVIVVDNNSVPPLANILDLRWHSRARVVVEERLGLVHARCRGFVESQGDLIVNLDDDAILDSTYLDSVLFLAQKYPFVGVFGAQIRARFEQPPKKPAASYYAAERIVTHDMWSNLPENMETTAWGAGSVVRRTVALKYLQRISDEPRLLELGRRGNSLMSCEDIDIANSACELGLGKGVFKDLVFTHLIPSRKMTDEFTISNAYWNTYSAVIHNFIQFRGRLPPKRSWQNICHILLQSLFRDVLKRKMMLGELRAERDATEEIRRRGWT